MGEGPSGLSVVDLATMGLAGATGLVGRVTEYWASRSGRLIHVSWQRLPHKTASWVEIDQTSARVWVCREGGRPVRERPEVGESDEVPLSPLADGSYVWDEAGTPKVLFVLPAALPLAAASPPPSGVWESEGRICAFWQEPKGERKITFKTGSPSDSLSRNVEFWQDRVSGLQARRSRGHPIAVSIVILVVAVIVAIVLGVFNGQATAAAWVGTGGTVISLANTFVLPQLRSKSEEDESYSA